QGARLLIIRAPGTQTFAMMLQQIQQVVGIAGVIFTECGREGLAILSQRGRIDGDRAPESRIARVRKSMVHDSARYKWRAFAR
ncbi:MAG TPA: hypothetical protein VLE19_01490, partial [Pyrinomonadaceae bacterium]|nr:hypothetical protein [Pyrinomonadaceae bacterium]